MGPQSIAEVFLLAENRLLREALIRILAKKSDIRVIGAAPYSPSAQERIIASRPEHHSIGRHRSDFFRREARLDPQSRDSRKCG